MAANGKRKYFNISYAAFIAAALALLSLAVLSFLRFEQQKKASGWISHTFQVKLKIEQILSLINHAETSQRGFLLTNDSSYLDNFLTSKEDLTSSIVQLDSLIIDNPKQFDNLSRLDQLVKDRFIRMEALLDSSGYLSKSLATRYLLPGSQIMDSIQAHLARMEALENSLLSTRIEQKRMADKNTSIFILLFSVISLVVLLLSFLKVKTENTKRAKAEIDVDFLETKVAKRTAEIKQINQLLTEQNIDLERKNAELASFTFMASHDLKEPLRKIETFADRIVQTEAEHFSDRSKEYFEKIIASIKRMQSLIDSVFMYAETNITAPGLVSTDLNKTIATALEILHEQITEKNVVVEYAVLPVINAIPEQMEQLFINLIGNAIKYSKANTQPVIKITAQSLLSGEKGNPLALKAYKIDFSDNGIGFDEKYLDKIFQIFQRLHNKDAYSGTGIGLAICKKIAENHHGTIMAKSTPGNGAIFSVFIPAT
jgi:signal transduction histidine kinase